MALVEVSCPGCNTILKAPQNMAGKKARCKKCNTPFRIPGGAPAGDSVGESQMLSAMDAPLQPPPPPASAFDFGGEEEAAPPPPPPLPKKTDPKPAVKAAEPRTSHKPAPAPKKAPAPASDSPFSFGDEPAPEEAPHPATHAPKTKPEPSAPVGKLESTQHKHSAKPGKAKVAPPPPTAEPDNGFNFGSMLDEAAVAPTPPPPPPAPGKHKAPSAKTTPAPVEEDEITDAEDVAEAEAVPESLSLDDEPANDDPFGFPDSAEAAPTPSQNKSKNRRSHDDHDNAGEDEHQPRRGGYRKANSAGGGKKKLIFAAVGVLLLGGAIAGVVLSMSKSKPADEHTKPAENEKKDEAPKEDIAPFTKNDATTKELTTATQDKGKGKIKGKGTPNQKGTIPDKKGDPGETSARPALVLDKNVKAIKLQPLKAKPEPFQAPIEAVAISVPFEKIVRFFPPSKIENDFGVLWTETPGKRGAGSDLVFDICAPAGTKQYRINFTGNSQAPACDMSENSRWFAHVDNGKLTVWKAEDQTKLIEELNLHALSPDFKRGGIVAVYFPGVGQKDETPPKHIVTISSAGAVHLWDLTTKKLVGPGYLPPHSQANRVSSSNATTLAPGRNSVLVAVGGAIYQVAINADGLAGSELVDLGGDVPISRALAMSSSGPMLYAFETDSKKKECVVRVINNSGVSKSWRWPADAGVPIGAAWVDGQKAVISSSNGGGMWFELNETDFFPEGFALPPKNKCLHATNEVCHWYLIPHPGDAARTGIVQLGPTGLSEDLGMAKKGTIPTWRLDEKGLSR